MHAPEAPALSLLPDCGGAITRLAVSVVPQCFADHPIGRSLLGALGSFVATLPAEITLAILAAPETRSQLDRWLDRIRPECGVAFVPAGFHCNDHTVEFWTQDSFLVAKTGDACLYLKPASENPTAHAEWLGRALGKTVLAQPYGLAGGNLLVGPDFKLIGCESLSANGRLRADAMAALGRIDPRSVFEVGYRLGDGRSDPASTPSAGHGMDLYRMRQHGGHIDRFVAVTGLRKDGRPLLIVASAVRGPAAAAAEFGPIADRLDRTARTLVELGFAVERNAVPFVPSIGKIQLRPRPFNNVLVENQVRPDRVKPLVWVPQFGGDEPDLDEFDTQNLAVWRDLGFDPIPVPGWSTLSIQMGALRCATKVLDREEWFPEKRDTTDDAIGTVIRTAPPSTPAPAPSAISGGF